MKNYHLVSEEELTVAPLTADEKKWVVKFSNLLAKCPKRLEPVTCGDTIFIVDGGGASRSEMADGACDRDGIVLAQTYNGPKVHGISG